MTLIHEVSPGELGVDEAEGTPAYEERHGDAEIEWRLGVTAPLVVVAGPRRSGTSRAAARAARALLADHVVVGHDEAVPPPLPDLVARAEQAMRARQAPGAVVWLDGAGLATLDAITPALMAALPAGVRMVVTVEELLFCTWFPDPGTVGLLTAPGAFVRLDPRADGGSGPRAVRTVLTPVGWGSLLPIALARAAADWRRAGVPQALDRARLLALAREHGRLLGLGDADADTQDADTGPEDAALAAALDRIVAEDTHGVRLLRRHGTGPAAHYTAVPGADVIADGASTAAWPLPPGLVDLLGTLDGDARDVVARTLLLRSAPELVAGLVEDGWGHPNPTQAGDLAAAATRLGRPALAWHRLALGSARHAHVLAARRALEAAAADPRPARITVVPLRVRPRPAGLIWMRLVERAPSGPEPAASIPQPREHLPATPAPSEAAAHGVEPEVVGETSATTGILRQRARRLNSRAAERFRPETDIPRFYERIRHSNRTRRIIRY